MDSTYAQLLFRMILQPKTRSISQEQLVAEDKGIYAGLAMVEAKCIEVDNEQARLASAEFSPPMTKATLSELDVNKIVHNPKLRHDINFDPDLHFRPNLDGGKGRRKTQKANDFGKQCEPSS